MRISGESIKHEMIRLAWYLGMTKNFDYSESSNFPIFSNDIFDQTVIFAKYKNKELILWLNSKQLSMSIDDISEFILHPAMLKMLPADLAFIHLDYT